MRTVQPESIYGYPRSRWRVYFPNAIKSNSTSNGCRNSTDCRKQSRYRLRTYQLRLPIQCERVKNPKFLRTSAEKLARLQAKLAKRVKSSKSGKTIKKIVLNYKSGGGSTSLKKALASREKEACSLTVRP